MSRLPALALMLACFGVMAPSVDVQASPGDTIIVVDASNSMWGRVEGVAKIEIARRVFTELLDDWPADRRLGVIAYGHRRKGDCSDIEEIVPLGPLDAESAVARIAALSPTGRTPLTDAVEQAAEALSYRDVPATVVLLTDGIETCDRDPCALAESLERGGIGFTAHVIGFDVAAEDQPAIACIAERTGGRFLPAESADQLDEALRSVTVEAESEPAPPPPSEPATITFVAVDAATDAELPDTRWRITRADSGEPVGDGAGATLALELKPGAYQAEASIDQATATQRVDVQSGQDARHRLRIQLPLPSATLEAPAEVAAGSEFEVHWTGPNGKGDYVTIVAKGTPQGQYGDYRQTRNGSPVMLRAPDALGEHEVRYIQGGSKRILASAPVRLSAIEATLDARDSVPAGSEIEVAWTGPANRGDYITIVERGAPEGTFNRYRDARDGKPVRFQVPDAVGDYELRYVVGQSKRTLASRPVTLTAVEATLQAPDAIPAGSEVSVDWTGPDNPGDYITVVEQGAPEGTHNRYARTERGSPAKLQVPDAVGDYEIRYVVGGSKRTLASRTLSLTAVTATLEAPAEVPAGTEIEVHWTGPDGDGDYITVVEKGAPEGSHNKYRRTREGSPVRLQVPDALGPHEVRYVIGQSRRTLASQPITLAPVSAELRVDGPILPGAEFDVQWTGPDNPGDYITIVAAGAPEGSHGHYRRTRTGNPVAIRAPESGGRFEVRYVLGQSKRTLTSLPVDVGAAEVTLSAPETVGPSAVIEVAFTGPGRYQDLVELVPAGADAKAKAMRSARASQGSPLQLFAPAATGDYQLRYRMEDTGDVLATVPLRVE
jgi:Ca-activated chloride channel family protein